MRYRLKKRKWCILAAMLILLIGLSVGKKVEAATGVCKMLEEDKVYKKYDVTGDGAADIVMVSVTDSNISYSTKMIKVYVNNEKVYTHAAKEYAYSRVELLILEDGSTFFSIKVNGERRFFNMHKLYAYQEGKLKRIIDFRKHYASYAMYYDICDIKVSGNVISTEVSAEFWTTGKFLEFNIEWKYENGSFQRTKDSYAIQYNKHFKNKWTVKRKIVVYKKVNQKKVACILEKGDVIKIDKVRYTDTEVFFQIRTKDGKTGYIPGAMEYPSISYFKEAAYVWD